MKRWGLVLGLVAAVLGSTGAAMYHERTANPVTATASVGVSATQTNALDLATATFAPSLNAKVTFANGTGANQVNALWTDTRTLAASATENLDLAGVLTDGFGTTKTFTTVKSIVVTALAANTNNVIVGGAITNAWVGPFSDSTATHSVRPGGWYGFGFGGTGYTVTAGTRDILKIANSSSGTAVTYSIVILGVE